MHAADVAHQTELLQDQEVISLFDSMHEGDWRQFLYMARDPEWYPFVETENLDSLDMPVLFMVGEGSTDEVKTASIYPRTNERVHTAVIPFAGHLVHQEQPELYSKILDGFLQKIESV
ncbi:alpha/beta fold hydrolase [Virgibacillus flavescens]|uniref:alpha/beta fold hydrolase n=1 Tax=Virgibacillus flavescens TaxID=1611422 RepID=UPI003D3364F9